MTRKIIHIDLDAFFCAVEELNNPNLTGKPFAVGGNPTGRGVITSASYAARKFGVRSAMPSSKALRLCPNLQLVSSHFHNYRDYSKQVMNILRNETELVEQISIDEAFLDFSGSQEAIENIAKDLQNKIKHKTKLPSSLGAATNKLVAKIANNVGKASSKSNTYPNAITVVPAGDEKGFLAPLPAIALWGIGPKTAAKLAKYGLHTIGEVANWEADALRNHFGKLGEALILRCRGIDKRPISLGRETKSISHESTFFKDVIDRVTLINKIKSHCHSIEKRLDKANLIGSTVKIKLRWSNFETITRQISLQHPTSDSKLIYEFALKLLDRHWVKGKPVRLIGVGISNLQPPQEQLVLWDAPKLMQEERLNEVISALNSKYGVASIQTGKEFRKSHNIQA